MLKKPDSFVSRDAKVMRDLTSDAPPEEIREEYTETLDERKERKDNFRENRGS